MERVVAIEGNEQDIAYPFSRLREVGAVNDMLDSKPIVVLWQEGTVSTFGNSGVETGSTGVFSRNFGDQVLTLEWNGEAFIDLETGTQWNLLGEGVDGELEGSQLERVVSAEHFWFAWVAFKPDTIVWDPD